MAQTVAEAARHVRENIARIKSYLRRDETVRALETLVSTLEMYSKLKVIGNIRFELEVGLDEAITEVSRQSSIHSFLPLGANHKPIALRYIKGKEEVLCLALNSFAARLTAAAEAEAQEQARKVNEHRDQLLASGQECLGRGDNARARVFFARCADEFGQQEGLLSDIAARYKDVGLYVEAADMHQRGVDLFPKDPSHYAALIDCLVSIQEYEKAEKIYELVARQFGFHPKTLLKMAKFYVLWRKKDKAAEAAYRAIQMDPNLTEAQELLDKIDNRQI